MDVNIHAVYNAEGVWIHPIRVLIFQTLKVIAHRVQHFYMLFSVFFPYSSFFPMKMHATDAKTQIRIFLYWTKVSEAVCKRD